MDQAEARAAAEAIGVEADRRIQPEYPRGGKGHIRSGNGQANPGRSAQELCRGIGAHLRPEAKFLNGEHCDRGRTECRHVIATQLVHIGKEANKWEEQHFLGEDKEAEIEYGVAGGAPQLDAAIQHLSDKLGERRAAKAIGISRTALRRALKLGSSEVSRSIGACLAKAGD